MLADEARNLELHERLAQPEGGKDGSIALVDGPADDCGLVRLQERVNGAGVDLDAALGGGDHLGFQEFGVFFGFAHWLLIVSFCVT